MTLEKKSNDNSIKYIAQSEKFQEIYVEPNTMKNNSLPRKQNKNISQTKKFKQNIAAGGFKLLK